MVVAEFAGKDVMAEPSPDIPREWLPYEGPMSGRITAHTTAEGPTHYATL
jgi:hypothetical protein